MEEAIGDPGSGLEAADRPDGEIGWTIETKVHPAPATKVWLMKGTARRIMEVAIH